MKMLLFSLALYVAAFVVLRIADWRVAVGVFLAVWAHNAEKHRK